MNFVFFLLHVHFFAFETKNTPSILLAARVGRKRGKMNLEKTINRNMFDVSNSIRDSNPLVPTDSTKTEHSDTSAAPLSSILSNPKQRLTAQFKRAITLIKQRSEPANELTPPKLLTSLSLTEKPNYSVDPPLLTSLIEEPLHDDPPPPTLKSQSFVHIKAPLREADGNSSTAATVITLDPIARINQQNQNLSARLIKSNLPQVVTPQISSSSSATLSPTSSSSASTTGEITILVTNL